MTGGFAANCIFLLSSIRGVDYSYAGNEEEDDEEGGYLTGDEEEWGTDTVKKCISGHKQQPR